MTANGPRAIQDVEEVDVEKLKAMVHADDATVNPDERGGIVAAPPAERGSL